MSKIRWLLALALVGAVLSPRAAARPQPAGGTGVEPGAATPQVTIEVGYDAVGAAFAATGALLATTHEDGSLRLWDPGSGKPVRAIAAHSGRADRLAFSRDGKLIASVGRDRPAAPTSPDLPSIRLFEVEAGKQRGELVGATIGGVSSLAVDDAGTHLALGYYDGSVRLVDLSSGEQVLLGPPGEHTAYHPALAFAPGGRLLAFGRGDDREVVVRDLAAGGESLRLPQRRPDVRSLAFSPGGRWLAVGGLDAGGQRGARRRSPVEIWELATGMVRWELGGPAHATWHLAFSGDGRALVAFGGTPADNQVEIVVWDVESGRELDARTLEGKALALSADGRWAAARETGLGSRVTIWEAAPPAGALAATPAAAGRGPAAPGTIASGRGNRPPEVAPPVESSSSFVHDAVGRLLAATTTLAVRAYDPDGDPLVFSWHASVGTITPADPGKASWARPVVHGRPAPGLATVVIEDGRGGAVSHTFDLQ